MAKLKQVVSRNFPVVVERLRDINEKAVVRKLQRVFDASAERDTSRATAAFRRLLDRYTKSYKHSYGYSDSEVWLRASGRVSWMLTRFPDLFGAAPKRVLEVGCGDGMLGCQLAAYGHNVCLSDIDDWRVGSAQGLEFQQAPIEKGIDLPSQSFDFVVSYNSFEHYSEPQLAAAEIFRLLKPGAHLLLDFGPLYSSAYGMHCARVCPIPYCQYLFEEDYLSDFLDSQTLYDLGKESSELQPMNRWRYGMFDSLWESDDCKIVHRKLYSNFSQAGIILQFPESFYGLGLTVADVGAVRYQIVVQKQL